MLTWLLRTALVVHAVRCMRARPARLLVWGPLTIRRSKLDGVVLLVYVDVQDYTGHKRLVDSDIAYQVRGAIVVKVDWVHLGLWWLSSKLRMKWVRVHGRRISVQHALCDPAKCRSLHLVPLELESCALNLASSTEASAQLGSPLRSCELLHEAHDSLAEEEEQ